MAESKQRVMVTLTAQQVEKLDRVTDATAVSRSSILSLALTDWLARWERTQDATAEHSQGTKEYPKLGYSGRKTGWELPS